MEEWKPVIVDRENKIYFRSEDIKLEKITTIQKREKLNDVYALDIKGNGGANHLYAIYSKEVGIDGNSIFSKEKFSLKTCLIFLLILLLKMFSLIWKMVVILLRI